MAVPRSVGSCGPHLGGYWQGVSIHRPRGGPDHLRIDVRLLCSDRAVGRFPSAGIDRTALGGIPSMGMDSRHPVFADDCFLLMGNLVWTRTLVGRSPAFILTAKLWTVSRTLGCEVPPHVLLPAAASIRASGMVRRVVLRRYGATSAGDRLWPNEVRRQPNC